MPDQAENRHAAFLEELGTALLAQEGIDGDVVEILKFHLLHAKPGEDCVENAMAAILQLATKRAVSQ